jgi:glycosyltransferase involved in cell wall biosynthesis
VSRPALLVAETHPIQYHAPVYRTLQQQFGIDVTAVYGTDVSLRAYRDAEFGADVAWDVDLLGGYTSRFLSTVASGGATDPLTASARGIGQVLDDAQPMAVLIVGYSPAFHRRVWRAAWRRDIPILFRGETTDVRQSGRAAVALARDVALGVAYRSCARVLYIGQRSRRHYERLGVGAERLVFSPYAVDVTPFSPTDADRGRLRGEARREIGWSDDDLVIVFSGKLSERKGVDLLPPAIAGLPDALRRRVRLLCVGDGALRSALEGPGGPQADAVVRVLGVQPQAALSRWYHASDLLVLPSRHGETWGLVVNEALHHGVPAVVSDRVGCGPDLITPATGTVCEAGSVRSLTTAIERGLALAGSESTREACRRLVAGYTIERAAAGVAEALRGISATRSVA